MNKPAQSRSPATFYCLVVAILWVAMGLHLGITAYFRGRHPESLHGVWMACIVSAIFGALAATFFGWIASRKEANKRLRRGTIAAAVLFVLALASWPLAMSVSSP